MESVQVTEVAEMPPSSLPVEEVAEFAPYMEEEKKEEEDEPLMDGPVIMQLVPAPLPFKVILTAVPVEIRPLVEQLPVVIQSSFEKGIVQTKLVVELPSTEKVEIVIDQYDTDPTTFHISFYGSEQTGNLIAAKQEMLLKALQAALPGFAFAISPPFQGFSLPKRGRLGYSPVKQGKKSK